MSAVYFRPCKKTWVALERYLTALYEEDMFNLEILEIMKNFNLNGLIFLIKRITEVL